MLRFSQREISFISFATPQELWAHQKQNKNVHMNQRDPFICNYMQKVWSLYTSFDWHIEKYNLWWKKIDRAIENRYTVEYKIELTSFTFPFGNFCLLQNGTIILIVAIFVWTINNRWTLKGITIESSILSVYLIRVKSF